MTSKLEDLIALAYEPSSQRRRELLREVTDLFFVAPGGHNAAEMELFDGVLSKLAGELETEVRAELAGRFGDSPHAPAGLIRSLADDEAKVAGQVLAQSPLLSEADLLHVVRTRGQEHLRIVSTRSDVTTAVSDVIVARGDDTTLETLLRNQDAALSRRAHEVAVDRAVKNPELHEAMVQRQSVPIDLLNEMYFMVEAKLREQIMARNANVDPSVLEAALVSSRKRLAARDGALPADFAAAEAHIRALQAKGAITPSALAAFLRQGEKTRFLVALAELGDIDFHTGRRIVERRDLDALAVVCKAADFDRALFLTFTVLILEPGQAMRKAEQYGELYTKLSKETAVRTIRFWRMRRQTGDIAAA